MKNKKIDNHGFSLIEMIVSILIVGVIMIGVSGFLATSRMTYAKVMTSSKLQEEANVTINFINELLVEAQDFGWTDKNISGTNYTVLCIKTLDNEYTGSTRSDILKLYYYFILADKTTGKVYYSRTLASEDAARTIAFEDSSDGKTRIVKNVSSELFNDSIKNEDDRKYHFVADSLDTSSGNWINLSQSVEKNGRRIKIVFKFSFGGEQFIATVNNLLRNKLTF